MKEEFCIMPDNSPIWRNFRFPGSHRHEIFFGPNRKQSIIDGLVIFLPPELHNMSSRGIHFNRDFDLSVKRLAEKQWLNFYGRTIEEFRSVYGKNYLL